MAHGQKGDQTSDSFSVQDDSNRHAAVVRNIIFKNKQCIDWKSVEEYAKKYVGKKIIIEETKDVIIIGNDFVKEYAGSKYTHQLKGARAKAKANAIQCVEEMVKYATEKKFMENHKEKHMKDASNGWYYYKTYFVLPVFENDRMTEYKNIYSASLVINHAANGNMYLYDIVEIKKEASNPLRPPGSQVI